LGVGLGMSQQSFVLTLFCQFHPNNSTTSLPNPNKPTDPTNTPPTTPHNAIKDESLDRMFVNSTTPPLQLRPEMERITPMPSIYYPDFIAANQSDRADNVFPEQSKQQDLDRIRADIQTFKKVSHSISLTFL
jgi:hypothetical protein